MLEPGNRVVMITGANRGIGQAIAKTLAATGYKLSLGVRDESSLDISDFGDSAILQQYNATDERSAARWTQKTSDHFGSVDALVLNAGVMVPVALETGSESDLDLMWDVNFKGPLRLVRAALPWLRKSGHGRVVNIVSLSGKRLLGSGNLGYSASKFAALSLTHAIRHEGWKDGLRSTAICPGLVDTDMVSGVAAPEGEFKISPGSIADTAAYVLSLSNDASVAEILVNSRLESSF